LKRKILILFLIIHNVQLIIAQNSDINTYYVTGELSLGNYVGLDYTINYIFKDTYALKLGFSGKIRKPKSAPEDYSGGLNSVFTAGIDFPYDHLLNYDLSFGKIYNFNDSHTIRLNFLIGIGYTIIKEPGNWQFVDNDATINLAENYSYTYRDYNTISFIINPKIEFPLSNFFGLSISPMLQFNKDRTYFGIGFGTMLGKLK